MIPEKSHGTAQSVVDKLANFHVVEPGFWRSAQPNMESFRRLKTFGLKTLVNLHSDSLNNIRESRIADSLEISYFYFPMDARERPDHKKLQEILRLIQAPENRPVLVHCLEGKDLTGLIAGVYKMQYSDIHFEDLRHEMLLYGYNEKDYPFISITVEKWRDYLAEQPTPESTGGHKIPAGSNEASDLTK